jgi:putative glutamine amidotransferase
MIARPLIGLTGRRKRGADVAGFPAGFADVDLDVYVSDYARAITAAGGLPVHLPQHVDPGEYAGHLDGLLLSGGADVDPARYGAAADLATGPIEDDRDRAEIGLIELAVGEGLPVLGICRGLQLLNVWAGGTLHQDVASHARYDRPPADRVDTVVVEPDSRLGAIYGATVRVNSLHHQTVDRVADGWLVTARSGDGTVEAIEWPKHEVLAVQWHPELLPGAATDPVFAWLVERSRARSGDGVWGRSPRGEGAIERSERAPADRATDREPGGDGVWGRSPQGEGAG